MTGTLEVGFGIREMRVLNEKGDLKIQWSEEKSDEVLEAEKVFNNMLKKGYSAFKQTRAGIRGEQLYKFDATAERIILVPALSGG